MSSTACAPDCKCGRHTHRNKPADQHPKNCKCTIHAPKKKPKAAEKPKRTGQYNCAPGCTCSKHNRPLCPPGCGCKRHKPNYKRNKPRQPNPERCLCGHLIGGHDIFGCHTCDNSGEDEYKPGKPVRYCKGFRAETGPRPKEDPNDQRIAEAHMLKHIGELAICSKCLMPVKIGKPGTLAAVIAARAHAQLCKAQRESHGRQAI